MRSLVQISHPTALATTTTDVTNSRLSPLCGRKRLQIFHQSLHASSRIISRQAATVVPVDAAAVPCCNPSKKSDSNAIGITGFLEGKNYLVSGATGFLAKAFVEKLMRTVPGVGKIFVLIKAKNKEEAKRRLYSDIIQSDIFETLKQTYGGSYEIFMETKLAPVMGNIAEDNLGMDDETIDEISSKIDIIINSAASTTLDERYDVALNINTQGPARLLSFAKKCKNLSLFLQFSTAYANGKREGHIVEKPLHVGQSIAAKRNVLGYSQVSIPVLDVKSEIELAQNTSQSYDRDDEMTSKLMKELGQERASLHGWKNCYTLTKAMGEMLLNNNRGDLPVVIIRPSMIESAYKEPYPGWIQGNKVLDPIISLYGKGSLPGFVFDPQALVDVIPVDMVVNTAIAAMAKHGQARRPELTVYHATSSSANPLSLKHMFEHCYDYFTHYPLKDPRQHEIKIQKMENMSSVQDFSAYISKIIADQDMIYNGKSKSMLDMKQKRKGEYFISMVKLYQPYFFYYGRFDNTNSKKLIEEMSPEDKEMFDFDIWGVDWKDYFMNIHIPGIRKHVMKGRC